jgi:hypothetical protein
MLYLKRRKKTSHRHGENIFEIYLIKNLHLKIQKSLKTQQGKQRAQFKNG